MQPLEDQLLWDVEEQLLDEASFLFAIREAALDAPHYDLDALTEGPERRLLAQIDALVVAGPAAGEKLLIPAIEGESSYSDVVAAATMAVLAGSSSTLRERVFAVLDTATDDDQRSGVIAGLSLHPQSDGQLDSQLIQTLTAIRGPGAAARLEVLANRQIAVGDWLAKFLVSDDLAVVRAAARLARFCTDQGTLEALASLAQSPDPELRRVTLETALCRQVGGAWELALYWAQHGEESPVRRDALTWVAMLGDAAMQQQVLAVVEDTGSTGAHALWASGFSGRVAAVDRSVELLDHETLGPLAAEVVCAVVGLPVDEDQYWREPLTDGADEALPPLEHDDLDADLVPSAEDALPTPNAETIRRWWFDHKRTFDPALRYLSGKPLDNAQLADALRWAPMRRRHNLALELAVRTGRATIANTRELCVQQRAHLAELDLIR